jgi:hypothetical protein
MTVFQSVSRTPRDTHCVRSVQLAFHGGELVISAAGCEVARHRIVGPGELSLHDEHYGRAAHEPVRAIRPRSAAEIAFCSLGPVAEAFLPAAAASGTPRLGQGLAAITDLGRAHDTEALVAAMERALAFRRYGAADVRSILAAGTGTPVIRAAGERVAIELPVVPVRPLSAYAIEAPDDGSRGTRSRTGISTLGCVA